MMADKVLQGQKGGNSTLDQLQKSIDDIDRQLQTPNLTEEQRGQLQTTKDSLLQQIEMTKQQLAAVEESVKSVPKENIALFQKYDKEIREHGMTGLEFLGL
jgi:flagellar biosynthesis/type III secretory pathway chaperone